MNEVFSVLAICCIYTLKESKLASIVHLNQMPFPPATKRQCMQRDARTVPQRPISVASQLSLTFMALLRSGQHIHRTQLKGLGSNGFGNRNLT